MCRVPVPEMGEFQPGYSRLDLRQKLAILADAAKYDASCASSGSYRKNPGGIGNTDGNGICHSYTPDGRCVSLLKILLTNQCIYDCGYCINRLSSNVQRARFTVEEVVTLTLEFYRRNYIEGLFLSSGVMKSPDSTMEEMVEIARRLRQEHQFGGYIHLKAVAGCAPGLLHKAAQHADRLSANIELPKQQDLDTFAPAKRIGEIEGSMAVMAEMIDSPDTGLREKRWRSGSQVNARRPLLLPAGQSTQLIVGASASSDAEILGKASQLYRDYRLKRVYYTGYSPIPDGDSRLPLQKPPLMREHRLYQADWLVRHYGFDAHELFTTSATDLDLRVSPKLRWALRNRHYFPVDVNRASREALLRVPGIGLRNADRIVQLRRFHTLRWEDLAKLRVKLSEARFFILAGGGAGVVQLDSSSLETILVSRHEQLTLLENMAAPAAAVSEL